MGRRGGEGKHTHNYQKINQASCVSIRKVRFSLLDLPPQGPFAPPPPFLLLFSASLVQACTFLLPIKENITKIIMNGFGLVIKQLGEVGGGGGGKVKMLLFLHKYNFIYNIKYDL